MISCVYGSLPLCDGCADRWKVNVYNVSQGFLGIHGDTDNSGASFYFDVLMRIGVLDREKPESSSSSSQDTEEGS